MDIIVPLNLGNCSRVRLEVDAVEEGPEPTRDENQWQVLQVVDPHQEEPGGDSQEHREPLPANPVHEPAA
jgi:hypothetical protein